MKKIKNGLLSLAVIAALATPAMAQNTYMGVQGTNVTSSTTYNFGGDRYNSGVNLNVGDVIHGPASVITPSGETFVVGKGQALLINEAGSGILGVVKTSIVSSTVAGGAGAGAGLGGAGVLGGTNLVFVSLAALTAAGVAIAADGDDEPRTP